MEFGWGFGPIMIVGLWRSGSSELISLIFVIQTNSNIRLFIPAEVTTISLMTITKSSPLVNLTLIAANSFLCLVSK